MRGYGGDRLITLLAKCFIKNSGDLKDPGAQALWIALQRGGDRLKSLPFCGEISDGLSVRFYCYYGRCI